MRRGEFHLDRFALPSINKDGLGTHYVACGDIDPEIEDPSADMEPLEPLPLPLPLPESAHPLGIHASSLPFLCRQSNVFDPCEYIVYV